MKIGVLGTGDVGQTIARKMASLGHDVFMGSRSETNKDALAFAKETGSKSGTFIDAIHHGEWVFVAIDGAYTVETLKSAGKGALDGKIVVDISNLPIPDPSEKGSLGLTVQQTFPKARVVKTLNCVSAEFMTDPAKLPGDHTVFVSSDDAKAKAEVVDTARELWLEIHRRSRRYRKCPRPRAFRLAMGRDLQGAQDHRFQLRIPSRRQGQIASPGRYTASSSPSPS